jgi:hypothetical protein
MPRHGPQADGIVEAFDEMEHGHAGFGVRMEPIVSLMYGHWKMLATLGFSENWNRVSRETMDRLVGFYLRH